MVTISAIPVHARTYYVSSDRGSDTNAGTIVAPWKTIARVNAQLLKPGDAVALRRGDMWRETLRPRSSGSPGNLIIFEAYGSGPRPILKGSTRPGDDINIDDNEQSYIVYRELDLRGARQGLRLYAWRVTVHSITLENSHISTEASSPHGTMSAGVYASVRTGAILDLVVRHNEFRPHSNGLESWGVYFVKGVKGFHIESNSFGPAGEDAVCVWHSAHGVIVRNRGGHNGENTIDVKDSHDIVIAENIADSDAEYNIVVHTVDPGTAAQDIALTKNSCRRGGQGGHLTAGITLLFVENTKVSGNLVDDPYGMGIYVRDAAPNSGNEILGNTIRKGPPGITSSIFLDNAPGTKVRENNFVPQVRPTQ